MYKSKTKSRIALVALTASLLASISAPVFAAPPPPSPGNYTVYIGGEEYVPTEFSAQLVSPGCGTGELAAKVIQNYERTSPSGIGRLQCGTQTTSGLRHINCEHGQDWENIRVRYAIADDWSDLMSFALGQTLRSRNPTSQVGSKVTCVAPIQIKNSNNEVVRTYDVIVPIGILGELVITCYPTNGR